jgi:hypothetical protein
MSSTSGDDSDAGAPLPDFRTTGLQLQTIAPALGVPTQQAQPDYLDYDPKGRGIVVTMFANSGMAYLLGIGGGGVYGFRQGLASTPSNRFRVQLNSILNHSGRYGSRAGNTLGVFAVFYSIFEGLADQVGYRERKRKKKLMDVVRVMNYWIFSYCACVSLPALSCSNRTTWKIY